MCLAPRCAGIIAAINLAADDSVLRRFIIVAIFASFFFGWRPLVEIFEYRVKDIRVLAIDIESDAPYVAVRQAIRQFCPAVAPIRGFVDRRFRAAGVKRPYWR